MTSFFELFGDLNKLQNIVAISVGGLTIVSILVAVFKWFLNRPRLRIRISKDDPEVKEGGLVFEVENASPTPTSLTPTITSTYYYPKIFGWNGKKQKGVYDVREEDRNLPPYTPKTLTASARNLHEAYVMTWYRTYTFCPQKGKPAKIRIRNSDLDPVRPIRFWIELMKFRIWGEVPDEKNKSILDILVSKRSRGPH